MLKGINLTLMIGPAVPLPVSKAVLDALLSVEVTAKTDGPSVFQLKFTIDKRSPLATLFMLTGGAQIPLVRVVIFVTINGSTWGGSMIREKFVGRGMRLEFGHAVHGVVRTSRIVDIRAEA